MAIANEHAFAFANNPRVGTCELTASELWRELIKAHAEFWNQDSDFSGSDPEREEQAGRWCSDVLGVLGFEWV